MVEENRLENLDLSLDPTVKSSDCLKSEVDAGRSELLKLSRAENNRLAAGGSSGITGEFGKIEFVNSTENMSIDGSSLTQPEYSGATGMGEPREPSGERQPEYSGATGMGEPREPSGERQPEYSGATGMGEPKEPSGERQPEYSGATGMGEPKEASGERQPEYSGATGMGEPKEASGERQPEEDNNGDTG